MYNYQQGQEKRLSNFFLMYCQEIRRPLHYFVAAGVGGILTVLGSVDMAAAFVPFAVPFLVSSLSRSATRAQHRHTELLLELPAQRTSPAFVMCTDGRILACLGNTKKLFARFNVTTIHEFLQVPADLPLEGTASLFSPVSERWYRVSTFQANGKDHVLVWMDDITEEMTAQRQRAVLRKYQNEVMQDFSSGALQAESREVASGGLPQQNEHLARLILDAGYAAVLLAEEKADQHMEAIVCKRGSDGELLQSGSISISAKINAPVFRSRQLGTAVIADHGFDHEYPVIPEVREFLGQPIVNLVNYHAGSISILAFNKLPRITASDLSFIEAAVDAAHSLFTIVHAAEDRDVRFIQSIHGLCASAEFSDEITGSHIWRVNKYSQLIASKLCVDGVLCRDLGQVAAVHDIGKVAVPDLVQAPRKLTPEEWIKMQMHTIFGAQILDRMIKLNDKPDARLLLAREVALHHHQRWDGKGYPGVMSSTGVVALDSRDPAAYEGLRPLRGDEIPLSARIVSIADTYDALRSQRPYKSGFDHATTLKLIQQDDRSGARGEDRFGEDVYSVFMQQKEQMQQIFTDMS